MKFKCKVCGLKWSIKNENLIRICPRCESKAVVKHSNLWIIWLILPFPILLLIMFLPWGQ